jgi:hypothetical protein
VVLVKVSADRATMTVRDLVTGATEMMRADLGVLVQMPHESEGYFDAWLDNEGFSFGNRVPPPGNND